MRTRPRWRLIAFLPSDLEMSFATSPRMILLVLTCGCHSGRVRVIWAIRASPRRGAYESPVCVVICVSVLFGVGGWVVNIAVGQRCRDEHGWRPFLAAPCDRLQGITKKRRDRRYAKMNVAQRGV